MKLSTLAAAAMLSMAPVTCPEKVDVEAEMAQVECYREEVGKIINIVTAETDRMCRLLRSKYKNTLNAKNLPKAQEI